jgi:hypothetical protein
MKELERRIKRGPRKKTPIALERRFYVAADGPIVARGSGVMDRPRHLLTVSHVIDSTAPAGFADDRWRDVVDREERRLAGGLHEDRRLASGLARLGRAVDSDEHAAGCR